MLSILCVCHSLLSGVRWPPSSLRLQSQQILLSENMRPVAREEQACENLEVFPHEEILWDAEPSERPKNSGEHSHETLADPLPGKSTDATGLKSESEGEMSKEAVTPEFIPETERPSVVSDSSDVLPDKFTICDACEAHRQTTSEHNRACEHLRTSHADKFSTRQDLSRLADEAKIPEGYTPPYARLTRQKKGGLSDQQRSTTLHRPSRRGRYVPAPTDPRGVRSQTEPPTNKPPPDLLQVSWVWESRQPARTASVRRRPTRKVSCLRKTRPRLTIRKNISRKGSSTPQSRTSPGKDEDGTGTEWDEEEDVGEESKKTEIGLKPSVTPDVLLTGVHTPMGSILPVMVTLGEEYDTGVVHPHSTSLSREVKLRNNKNLRYFQSAGQALKQRWRNSDIAMSNFFRDSRESDKNDHGNSRRKKFLDRARKIPRHLQRLSNLLLSSVKLTREADTYGTERENDIIFLDLRKQLRDSLQRQRSVRGRSVPPIIGLKRQNSFSPRNSLGRNHAVTWNQKYQAVMGMKWGGKDCPVIQVTEAVADTGTPASEGEGEWHSIASTPLPSPHHSHLGLDLPRKKQNILKKLWGRLRQPTLESGLSSSWLSSSRSSMSGGSEDGHSPSHSSDYEDQDDERSGSASLVGRMRGLRRDMQKKISRLKSPRGSTSSSPGPACVTDKSGAVLSTPVQPSASSFESLPSSAPHGKVYQMTFASPAAPTASGSNRSSLSGEEAEPYTGPFIGRARALVDCQPSPYDRDALKFKKGDIIDIIAKNPSGLWKGCVDGRVGHFKFILVEEEVERPARRHRPWRGTTPRRGRSRTLEELLTRLNLGHLIQVFVLNGYEDLEQFKDVEKADLDCLGITDPETCAKLLTAVALLHDADSEPESDLPEMLDTTDAALRRGDHGRDSGCYTDHRSAHSAVLDENNLDTRQSTPSTDTSSGYHSRGPYNIPLGEATLTSREEALSSALDSPPSESTTSGATSSQPSTQSEPHSYRAHLATVLPASPRAKVRHPHQEDQKQRHDPQVDYEAKYNSARNVFEKEVIRREVPYTVRSPKRSTGTSQSPPSDSEECATTAPEDPSP